MKQYRKYLFAGVFLGFVTFIVAALKIKKDNQ